MVWSPRGRLVSLGGSGVLGSRPVIPLPLCAPWDAPPPLVLHGRHGTPVQLQARLRAELQGAQGPPGPGDVGRLPLLQATVSETLRLRPPAPLALFPCTLSPSSLGGLPVAAGTVLIPNLLAAQQDPDIWQHPEVFLPERFLAPGAPSRSLLPFGCGARSCPGEGLARAELFVFLGLILREFRLEPGPEGLPGLRGSPGTVLRCPSFRLRMVPCQPPGLP
uniref:Steroid 21-hydroxylase n=1 Tax=Junco hyemalis TaxID=40217 RepID=A0A8C5IRG0_JUNHY